MRTAALPVFGPRGGSAFPLLLDTGVFAASEYYLRSVRANRPMAGFRTLPPALFAVLVELRARQILGDVRHQVGGWPDHIPLRLWLTSPVESFRLWFWVAKASSHSGGSRQVSDGADAFELIICLTGEATHQRLSCPLCARTSGEPRSTAVTDGETATSDQVSATCTDVWAPVGAPKAGVARTEHTTGIWPTMTSRTVDG